MKQEARAAVYDEKLRVEAYRLAGMAQPFPAHFHAGETSSCSPRGTVMPARWPAAGFWTTAASTLQKR